jgi:4-amino-4-deoxy-L-arabinose transferase-like glycosyltransferase
MHRLLILALLLIAFALRLTNLGVIGAGNQYYAGAVLSMNRSLVNFFFVAAEPGGSVMVDKPPLGLWTQAVSAALIGQNTLGLILPQLMAGLLSIAVLYRLVSRGAGRLAGRVAAGALAFTPVLVALDRNNTMDSQLVLTLLLAAWAFGAAARHGSPRLLVLGGVIVGLGFNIKMAQALLPLPAFYALYFFMAPLPWARRAVHLVLTSVVLAGVALSWAAVVDLTPADQRPYAGSSQSNSVLELALGYNGLQRLLGNQASGPADAAPPAGPPAQPLAGGGGPLMPVQVNPILVENGAPGLLRFFQPPLVRQMSWLLPLSLMTLLLLAGSAWQERGSHPPGDPAASSLLLWGGWLLTGLAVLSVAGFMHAYYTSIIAAPAAALVGIGVGRLWRARLAERWRPALLLIGTAGVTLAFQWLTLAEYRLETDWHPVMLALGGLGGVALLARPVWIMRRGMGLLMAALLLTPLAWSLLTVRDPLPNLALPGAYDAPYARRDQTIISPNRAPPPTELIDFFQAGTTDREYLVAVPSAQIGAPLLLATGRPIFYLGGFSGEDPILDAAGLAALVESGRLRYVWDVMEGLRFRQPALFDWLEGHCTPVTDLPIPGFAPPPNAPPDMPIMQRVYDCA